MIRGEKTKRAQPANARNPGYWKARERTTEAARQRRSLAEMRAWIEREADVSKNSKWSPMGYGPLFDAITIGTRSK